jgi:hydroxymethylbilane synthase
MAERPTPDAAPAARWTRGRPVRLGTRRSELAMRQTRLVQSVLAGAGIASEPVTFDTLGDRRLDKPLNELGGKGLFTAELEAALRAGEVDLCVHSLKDLPTVLPAEIDALALLEREDPRDALVTRAGAPPVRTLADLPTGARVGTSALRRRAQLLAARPDLAVADVRGNVGTRLAKLDAGEYDVLLLAGAGLRRLGLGGRITGWLGGPDWVSAPGQGAIAVQGRRDDADTATLLAALHHAPTGLAVTAERAFLRALEGGCQVPIGAYVGYEDARLVLHGLVAALDGSRVLRGVEVVDVAEPAAAGARLAARLVADGADALLGELRTVAPAAAP